MSYKVLKILASVYLACYIAFIVDGLVQGEIVFSKTGGLTVLLIFLLFTAGYTVLWFNSAAGGIMLQAWHLAIWVFSLFTWNDAGGAILFAFPVLIIGVFLNLNAYVKSGGGKRADDLQWKFVFRLLLINYTILYFVVVLSDLITRNLPDLMSWPYIVFPVLLIIYITGVILSWSNAIVSGILFIIWYLTIVLVTIFSPEFTRNGPYALMGFPLFLQSLLYFKQRVNYL